MPTKKVFSNREFIGCVRDYLGADARICSLSGEDKNSGRLVPPAGLESNSFYWMAGEAVSALWQGIEDMAIEEANGSLVTVLGDFAEFASHRNRYEQLATALDRVEVVGSGRAPRPVRRVRFTRQAHAGPDRFFLVLYQGRRGEVLFVCRQMNAGRRLEDGQYVGFYSLHPAMIARFQRLAEQVARGGLALGAEFSRLLAIDRAGRELAEEFSREKAAVFSAMRRLQTEGSDYRAESFASDIEKGLLRLHAWKERLPALLRSKGV